MRWRTEGRRWRVGSQGKTPRPADLKVSRQRIATNWQGNRESMGTANRVNPAKLGCVMRFKRNADRLRPCGNAVSFMGTYGLRRRQTCSSSGLPSHQIGRSQNKDSRYCRGRCQSAYDKHRQSGSRSGSNSQHKANSIDRDRSLHRPRIHA